MFKNKIPWMVAFVFLAILSIWTITSQSQSFSPKTLMETIRNANPLWMAAAVLSMFFNIFFEGKALETLIRGLTTQKKNKNGLLYSSADIYFSAITPSASGGQPASAFFMIKDGIPVAQTTVILIVNLFMFSLALMVVGVLGIIASPGTFAGFSIVSKFFVTIGYVLLIGLCALFVLILKKEQWIRKVFVFLINLCEKLKILHNREKKLEKVERLITQYRECADLVQDKKHMLAVNFGYNLLQRFALLSTTIFVYLGFGGSFVHLNNVFSIQSMVLIGSYSIPVPGAMGVADYLLIDGLKMVKDVASPANLELVSRGISFYCCIALSIIIVVTGYIRQARREKKKQK